jgi:hypothetical protein
MIKRKNLMSAILSVFLLVAFGQNISTVDKTGDFPVLKGPYLGQKPPGMVPEIFAPGIISTEKYELNSIFSPKGDEFFFCILIKKPRRKYIAMYTRQLNGVWTKPEVAPFSRKYNSVDMAFSLDGNKLYFCSDRPASWNPSPDDDIWVCRRLKNNNWSEPENLGLPVNSLGIESYPCFTKNGRMYFASTRKGGKGVKDVYYSKWISGKFCKPVNLETINTKHGEGDIYVDPYECYLIVCSWGRADSYGGGDLYISFKDNHGNWSSVLNMGKLINTEHTEYCPVISPDGKYLIFTRDGNIYWVDARIITKFKQRALKHAGK